MHKLTYKRQSHRATSARANLHQHGPLMTSGGTCPPQFDASFQVPHQNEPTPANPVSQHKQFKGHATSHTAGRVTK